MADIGAGELLVLLLLAAQTALFVLLIVFAVRGIRWFLRSRNPPSAGGPPAAPDDLALALLRERFARGEIDPDEFEQRRRMLDT